MFIPQGPRPWPIIDQEKSVVLVYRLDKLIPPRFINRIHLQIKTRWEAQGIRVKGIQIDYDSPTQKLGLYSAWLSRLRQVVPIEEPISITGLCDWLVSARDEEVLNLTASADFIAFMMYRGTRPLKLADSYIKKLQRAEFNFYIGLLKSQLANPLFSLVRETKGYRGVIVFPLDE